MSDYQVPGHFFEIPYDGEQYPGCPCPKAFKAGANCQRFAYELLRHFGYDIPELRSSNLWEDSVSTYRAVQLRPLDILLFNKEDVAYGAHLGVYLEDKHIIHLSKEVGLPAIWSMEEFAEHEQYRFFLGAKRVRSKSRTETA